MEEASDEWQIDDDEQENSNRESWILNKSLRWGKNIIVTGVIVSSAPIVLPPLMVISVVGLFCSIPYGFFLASHACTQKLMSILLPHNQQVKGDDEEIEFQIEDFRDDSDLHKEGQGVEVMMIEEDPGLGVVSVQYVCENVAAEEDFNELAEQLDQIVSNYVDESYGKSLEENERVRKVVDTEPIDENEQPVVEVSAVEIAIEVDENKGMASLDVAVELSDNSEDKELVSETKGLIEQLRDEGETHNVVEEDKVGRQKAGRRKKRTSKKSDEMPNVAANEMADSSKKKNVESVAATNKAVAATNESKNVGSIAKKYPKPVVDKGAVPVPQRQQAENNVGMRRKFGNDPAQGEHESTVISLDKDIDMASDKVVNSEKKIWEQIHAMRTIVGYKATLQESTVEELKALYLFTGVEPPSSFTNSSDLSEVNDKLRFLMSIVGVK